MPSDFTDLREALKEQSYLTEMEYLLFQLETYAVFNRNTSRVKGASKQLKVFAWMGGRIGILK